MDTKKRNSNAERQARFRERQKLLLADSSSSFSVSDIVPMRQVQQMSDAIIKPAQEGLSGAVRKLFEGYEFSGRSAVLAAIGIGGGAALVNQFVDSPRASDFLYGMGAGVCVGLLADVFVHRSGLSEAFREVLAENPNIVSGLVQSSLKTPTTALEMSNRVRPSIRITGILSDFLKSDKIPLHSSIQVDGASGAGKSHLLAKLSGLFGGSVLYLSTEEIESDAVQGRFFRYNAQSVPFVGGVSSQDEVLALVEKIKPSILFIDSISGLHLRQLEEIALVKSLANRVDVLVYSLHATKQGDFKGSNTLLHDCAVEIAVAEGVATVRKNRVGGLIGQTLELFSEKKSTVFPIQSVSENVFRQVK